MQQLHCYGCSECEVMASKATDLFLRGVSLATIGSQLNFATLDCNAGQVKLSNEIKTITFNCREHFGNTHVQTFAECWKSTWDFAVLTSFFINDFQREGNFNRHLAVLHDSSYQKLLCYNSLQELIQKSSTTHTLLRAMLTTPMRRSSKDLCCWLERNTCSADLHGVI